MKFSFAQNLAEGRPAVDVGWCWRGSSAGGVQLLDSVCRKSSSEIYPLQKFDRSPIYAEAQMGLIYRGISAEACLQ